MVRYRCLGAMLPVVEAALAAQGYAIEAQCRQEVDRRRSLIMTRGMTTVMLVDHMDGVVGEIEVLGDAQSAVTELLESLPVTLHKQPQSDDASQLWERE